MFFGFGKEKVEDVAGSFYSSFLNSSDVIAW
jgi:hypothetical protein